MNKKELINKFIGSSKCGNINKEISDLSIRKWECPWCGNKNDRDINASINILNKGRSIYYKRLLEN